MMRGVRSSVMLDIPSVNDGDNPTPDFNQERDACSRNRGRSSAWRDFPHQTLPRRRAGARHRERGLLSRARSLALPVPYPKTASCIRRRLDMMVSIDHPLSPAPQDLVTVGRYQLMVHIFRRRGPAEDINDLNRLRKIHHLLNILGRR